MTEYHLVGSEGGKLDPFLGIRRQYEDELE